jgi:hypothetical protein
MANLGHGRARRTDREDVKRIPRMKPSLRRAFDISDQSVANDETIVHRLIAVRLNKDDTIAAIRRFEDSDLLRAVLSTMTTTMAAKAREGDERLAALAEFLGPFAPDEADDEELDDVHMAFLRFMSNATMGGFLEGIFIGAAYAIEYQNRPTDRPRR